MKTDTDCIIIIDDIETEKEECINTPNSKKIKTIKKKIY